MIVLDASAAVALLFGGPRGGAVAARIADPAESLHAPHLLDVEVAHVVRRHARSGALAAPRGRAVLDDLLGLGLRYHAHGPLLPRVWALRENLSAYDATYVALAEALGAPLLTADARLAAAPGVRARVEVVGA